MLKLRVAFGTLYVGLVQAVSRTLQRAIPKQSQLGRKLARIKRLIVPGPVPRLLVLLKALSKERPVRFVQIGANDGVLQDPLRPFISSYRWQGVLVEPLPDVFDRLRQTYRDHKGLAFENAAIAAQSGPRDFYYVAAPAGATGLPAWHAGLGSLTRETILKHSTDFPELVRHVTKCSVQCLTFDQLCEKHHIADVDVIAIDAEGQDFEILNLIDLSRRRPLIVIYEHHHMTPAQIAAAHRRMSEHGYEYFEEVLDTVCFRVRGAEQSDRRLLRLWRDLNEVAWIPV